MLSSIHPLGERARHNRWPVTVGAFTLGSMAAGALVGSAAGAVGSLVVGNVSEAARLTFTGVVALAAGALDIARVNPPGPKRQVNEHWIGHYRGWVYGGSFGVELGLGVMTYIVTWGVYATFLAELVTGSWVRGAAVGAIFGFGRSIAPLLAGWIDRPSRLTVFHARMNGLGSAVRSSGAVATAGLGTIAILGVML